MFQDQIQAFWGRSETDNLAGLKTRKFQLKKCRSRHHLKISADSYPMSRREMRSGLSQAPFLHELAICNAGEETAEKVTVCFVTSIFVAKL